MTVVNAVPAQAAPRRGLDDAAALLEEAPRPKGSRLGTGRITARAKRRIVMSARSEKG